MQTETSQQEANRLLAEHQQARGYGYWRDTYDWRLRINSDIVNDGVALLCDGCDTVRPEPRQHCHFCGEITDSYEMRAEDVQ